MNKQNSLYLYVLVVLFAIINKTSYLQAQNDLRFNHLTVIDGLMHNSVTSITQDSTGFIWLGTQRGLNRYDGYKIDTYLNEADLYATVYNNRIRRMVILDNYIWVATFKGLQCFDITKKKYIDFKEDNHNELVNRKQIQFEFIDSQHRIWIGTRGKLEYAWITNNQHEVLLKHVEIDNHSYLDFDDDSTPEVVELSDGTMIMMAGGKLFQLQSSPLTPQKIQKITIKVLFPGIKTIKAVGNDLWLFSSNKAIAIRFQQGQIEKFDEISYPNSSIVGVAFSPIDIWLSTNQGLMKIAREPGIHRVQFHNHSVVDPYSVATDHQSGVFIDNQHNLWVSTWSGGVSYANIGKQKFNLVRYMPIKSNRYLPSEFVYAIHEDSNGLIYIGTKFGGISRFNLQTQTFDYTVNLQEKLHVKGVVPCIDSDDEWIYAAITSNGSSIYRINKLNQKIELVKSYKSHTVFSFGFDNHRQLWVGVLGLGLSCLQIENGKVIHEKLFTTQSDPILNLSSNEVNYVFNDKQKNEVLVSTVNGLNRLMLNTNGEVSSIAYYLADEKNPHTLSSNYVWRIDKENDSTYWVGTLGSGLNRIVIGKRVEGMAVYKAEQFGIREGAPSNDIESVLVDKFGNVWCGGRYLSQFSYKTKRFKTYYEEDGLQSYLFGTGTSCKTRNGMLFFGGLKGLNYFIPDTTVVRKQFKTVFSRLIVDGRTIGVGDTVNGRVLLNKDLQYLSVIKLPYPCNNLKIEFSSLTFSKNKNIQYRYKLEGFDNEWIYTDGMSTFAMYPKLPYRNYKFIVETGVDNQWSMSKSSVEIDILPPWWKSIWASIIYILLFSFIIMMTVRYSFNWINMKRRIALQDERERQKEELMELKMNFFTNISHEFKTPLTLINAAISEAESQNELLFGNRYFQVIKRNNAKLLHLINDLMDFQRSDALLISLKATQIDVRNFIQEIFEEFLPLSEKSKINMHLILPSNEIQIWADEELLTKIISNVIANSLHNTESGGSIEIQLTIGEIDTYKTTFKNKVIYTEGLQAGNHVIFSVKDTGVGISSGSLPEVFKRFHTIISRTTKHLGSGIGLALVKSLVALHKGGLIMSSERNVGTEFVFSIPMESDYLSEDQKIIKNEFDRHLYFNDYKTQASDEEVSLLGNNDATKPTLLLVDDNQEILMILSEHFKSEFNILMALDGKEALELCNKKFPDIIVSDVMMPRMNGLELCNRIKSQMATCFIPIILLTARGTIEQQIEGLHEGADGYIPKPFHFGLLHSTIINLLNKARLANQLMKANDMNAGEIRGTRNLVLDQEKQQFIDRLTELITLNLDNSSFTIDNLCLEMGVSRSSMYAQMKSIANESIGNFIREIRFQKAAELLRSTSLSISEVAYQVGIDSPSFFTRAFKERFGMPPSEYVKKIINT